MHPACYFVPDRGGSVVHAVPVHQYARSTTHVRAPGAAAALVARALEQGPGEVELELYDPNGPEVVGSRPMPFTLRSTQTNENLKVLFSARTARDRNNRKKYFPTASLNLDFQHQAKTLDPSFEKSFGCSYGRFLHVLASINTHPPAPGSYPVLFYLKEGLAREIAMNGIGGGMATAKTILAGFTLTRQQMTEEGRQIFLPNQEHRALRRGYFEFPHITGMHLAWSACLAEEGLDHLVDGVCFKKLPKEWLTPETEAALDDLFARTAKDGKVAVEYETEVYYGRLSAG
jgi:hypothetical protein